MSLFNKTSRFRERYRLFLCRIGCKIGFYIILHKFFVVNDVVKTQFIVAVFVLSDKGFPFAVKPENVVIKIRFGGNFYVDDPVRHAAFDFFNRKSVKAGRIVFGQVIPFEHFAFKIRFRCVLCRKQYLLLFFCA